MSQIDPALLVDAVKARLAQPEYGHYFRSEAPAPGSLGVTVQRFNAERAAFGGAGNVIGQGAGGTPVVDLAGSHFASQSPEPGSTAALATAQAQAAAQARMGPGWTQEQVEMAKAGRPVSQNPLVQSHLDSLWAHNHAHLDPRLTGLNVQKPTK
jgi:hypothetical protein